MNPNLSSSLDRADELLAELTAEYTRCLTAKTVTPRAVQMTHEICEKLRSVLDRLARRYWEQEIKPELASVDRKAATVYFPISTDAQAFESILGRWRWKPVRSKHQPIYDYLLALQPFQHRQNNWLGVLNDLAVQGKHIDIVPQRRTELQKTTITGATGQVAYTSGVIFGNNVSILGAPVNPKTQRIVPTPGLTEKTETLVSFVISGHNVNALGFCKEACAKSREIATDMSQKFRLS